MTEDQNRRREADKRDRKDPLAGFRSRFYVRPGEIYLDGNSLGLLCLPAEAALLQALRDWKYWAIGGWLEACPPWFFLAEKLAGKMAALVGAHADEVAVANSTTVNLHQLLATLFQAQCGRTKVLIDASSFPSDRYAIQSHLRLRGLDPAEHLKVVPSREGLIFEADLIAAMTDEVALAVLPSVVYTTAQLLDVPALAHAARERGVLLGVDCSHSAGVIPHSLSEWGVDFAFWCGYKYLNGGPGAAAALYLNRRHHGRAPGLAGWFSSRKERQFEMSGELEPAPDAGALQIGTPPILSMAPLCGALDIIEGAGVEAIRRKSLELTGYLMELVDTELSGRGFTMVTPREDKRRGGHVALLHEDGSRISRALRAEGVVPDFRPPNLLRLAPAPLYTSFADCWEAVERIRRIVTAGSHQALDQRTGLVP